MRDREAEMATKTVRVYADTSVYGGVMDEEFPAASRTFLDQARAGRFQLVVSPVLEAEIGGAPEGVAAVYREMAALSESTGPPDEAVRLQEAYLKAGIVGPKWADDALHVAFATVSRCSLLVSWNFKHIVHYDKIALYNAINVVEGYSEIGIHTPEEVIDYEEEDV
jgi:hypothetical protein